MLKETKYKHYFVDTEGNVYSSKIKGGRGKISNKLRKLKQSLKDGYLTVCLSYMENDKHIRKYLSVHRLVFETFNSEIPKDLTVDHINNIRTDNRLENLQLLSREENSVKRDKTFHFGNEKIYIVDGKETTISEFAKENNLSYKQAKRRIVL